ncbi:MULTISPECIES: alpha/beta fold hydrolase [unclassified Tessaracoccus]|uniref:alpha/beta fold hydrolase n=1 Tax=unclassified Tessaracoccus TaxID=2635419 RepID=UPI00160389FA|nr:MULTISPECIES: alpha/beta hydrolase [unclassified Tessaracoccus]MBB1513092.1 alpha/beta hydrolase [Tessaracoccus sp. MC1627]MBB1515787.1 alpha/beta hydrolase [Tessaracoccus sp. MC1679]
MPTFTTADDVTLHYTDTGGRGRPLVLVHGWPLSGEAFARNLPAFVEAGHRVITYDRRGFGQSDKPAGDVDYDVLADDLEALIQDLDLQGAVLLGFSMGGGEVARYFSRHGSERIAAAIFSGSITPALCISDDNPDGAMPMDGFQGMSDQCATDRDGFLDQFITWFYSTADGGLQVDEDTRQAALKIAHQSSPHAAAQTILIWATDLRDDCRAIDVPTLVIHGDGDINVPIDKSSRRMAEFVPDSELVVIHGGPHGVNDSHAEHWEREIIGFIGML